jgi:hypothetical protein
VSEATQVNALALIQVMPIVAAQVTAPQVTAARGRLRASRL